MSFLYFLAEHRNTFLTIFFEIVRFVGEEAVALVIIGYLYFWKDKKLAYDIGFTFFFGCLASNIMKVLVRIPRPWVRDPQFQPLPSALETATGYSFPSIHTMSAASLYGTLGASTRKKGLRILCVVLVLLVGLSRMYAGVHTPADVLVGLIVGILAVVLEKKFVSPLVQKEDPAVAVCIILAALSIIGVVICTVLIGQGVLDPELAADAYKIAGAGVAFAVAYPLDVTVIHFDNTANSKQKLIRLIIAVVTMLAFKESLKILLRPIGNIGHFIRYAVIIAWILIIYPMILMAIKRKKEYNN